MKKALLALSLAFVLVSPLLAEAVKIGDLTLDVTAPKKLGYGEGLFEGVLGAPATVTLTTPPVSIPLKAGAKIEYDQKKNYLTSAYVAKDTPLKASGNAIVIAADSQISITDLLGKVHLSFCCLASDTKLVMSGKELLAKKTGKRSDLQFNSYGEIVSAVLAKDLPYELGGVTYAFSEGCKVSFASGTGKLEEGGFKQEMDIKVGAYLVPLISGLEYSGPISFYVSGDVSRIYTSRAFTMKIDGQDFPVKEKEQVYFYEKGIVKRIVAGDNFNLNAGGKSIAVGYGQTLEFDKSGAFSKVSGSAKKKPAVAVVPPPAPAPPILAPAPVVAAPPPPILIPASLSQVPDSWNGDYALSTNPTRKTLTIKGGKIYLVMGASETQTFPALSSLKYVYAYSETECTAILGKTVDDSYKRDPATGKLTHLSSGITEYYLPLKK